MASGDRNRKKKRPAPANAVPCPSRFVLPDRGPRPFAWTTRAGYDHELDKDSVLVSAANNMYPDEWLYSPKPTDEGPDSHTWKYLREVRKPSNSGFHFDASRLSHSLIEGRPRSIAKEHRASNFYEKKPEDGDTDSSFSWQGSNNYLNKSDDGERQWNI